MNKYVVVFEDGDTKLYRSESLFQLVANLTVKYERVISITRLPDEYNDGVHTV